MKKHSLLVLLGCLCSTNAYATMPMLPDQPKAKTLKSCNDWAKKAIKSDQDVPMIWSLQESGKSSPKHALKRLADDCMGKEMPEIVGFNSSAGVA